MSGDELSPEDQVRLQKIHDDMRNAVQRLLDESDDQGATAGAIAFWAFDTMLHQGTEQEAAALVSQIFMVAQQKRRTCGCPVHNHDAPEGKSRVH